MTTTSAPVKQGSLETVPEILDAQGARSVLLVTGETSYQASGADRRLAPLLDDVGVDRFSGFQTNPRLDDLQDGIERVNRTDPDLVLAVGGGTVLDMAKMVNAFAANDVDPEAYARGEASLDDAGVPLACIPTTAGSGSEATTFAVLYIDGEKHSIDEPFLRPEHVVLDPTLTFSMPPRLTAVTGMDALCQGIESMWAIGSTSGSRAHSKEAVRLAWENLEGAVHDADEGSRRAMVQAANHAGQAINVSRTTAPHAVSYTLTMQHGVPHGHAVALTLGEFIVFNGETQGADALDPRGGGHVRAMVQAVCELIGEDSLEGAREAWYEKMARVGLEARLGDVGVGEAAREAVVQGVNMTRAKNNPRRLDASALRGLLARR